MKVNDKVIKLQIWDTCGQEIYKSLISNFYRNSSLAVLVYAIDNKESFNHVENWLNDLKSQANPDVRIFLVGNKADLEEDRKIKKEEGEKYKEDQHLENENLVGEKNIILEKESQLIEEKNKMK